MKLSQAILKGCEQHPQHFGLLFFPSTATSKVEKTCVLGAAIIGLIGSVDDTSYDVRKDFYTLLEIEFPDLTKSAVCPYNPCTKYPSAAFSIAPRPTTLTQVIVHLNDDHRMSREDIATWLDKQEI